MKFRVDEVFHTGRWTKAQTIARQAAAPLTNFVANHRATGGGAASDVDEHAHPTVEVPSELARLGTPLRTKQLSRELIIHATRATHGG